MSLGVMPHKYVTGIGSLVDSQDRAKFSDASSLHWTLDLATMMTTEFPTDAHFTCYHVPGLKRWPLLRKTVLQDFRKAGSDILTSYFVFDWDNPKSASGHQAWTDPLYQQYCELMDSIAAEPILGSWSAMYTTANGARIIYVLNKPIPVDRAEQHLVWMIAHFNRCGLPIKSENDWGIDTSCKDWTRRFRCPYVVRDNVRQIPTTLIMPDGTLLDPDLVGKADVRTLARRRTFRREDQGDCPTYDHLQGLLIQKSEHSSRPTMTNFHKVAKKAIRDTDFFDLIFNEVPPTWDVGTRNDNIMLMLGVLVPRLIRRCGANVKEIMSLCIIPILTLDHTHGVHPVQHTWNALLDIYEREIAKLNDEEEQSARNASIETDILNDMLVGMRTWCDDPALYGEEVLAREFVRSHIFASYTSYYYPMNSSGCYERMSLLKDQLIPRIRKTFLHRIIDTTKEGIKLDIVDVTTTHIQNRHSTPVFVVKMKPMGSVDGYIDNMNGERPELLLSMYKRNEKIEPKYSQIIDDWMGAFFGDMYELGKTWVGQALAFEDGPICAISLLGEPGAGKKLFTMGLAECLDVPIMATGEDLIYQSSTLTKTPFLNINEDWPRSSRGGSSPADTFKKLTAGDLITINEKYQPMISCFNPVRVILTGNDSELLRQLTKGRDMTLDTRIAIGRRVLHIVIPHGIIDFMIKIGNRATTAKPGARWIGPESGPDPSNYILASHFLYIFHNRHIPLTPARFLMQGNCSPTDTGNKDVFSEILVNNTRTTRVCHAIDNILKSQNAAALANIKISDDRTQLFVTRAGIYENIKEFQGERISQNEVLSSLGNIMVSKDPVKFQGVYWYEIDLAIMQSFVDRQGIAWSIVRELYANYLKKNPYRGAAE